MKQFKMREPQMCNVVCRLMLNAKTAIEIKEKIDDEYRVNMWVSDDDDDDDLYFSPLMSAW